MGSIGNTAFNRETTGLEIVKTFSEQVKGKTIALTGPSEKSLAAEAAKSLAHAAPAELIFIGRTESKIAPVIAEVNKIDSSIKTIFVQCDLANNASVRKAAAEINSTVAKIDILINSAGIMAVGEFTKSADGIELQFAANHVGHFLLTNLILEKIRAGGPDSRIVNLTSTGFTLSNVLEDYSFADGAKYNPWKGYGQAKSANVIFTHSLASKLAGTNVSSFVVHPGLVLESNIIANISQDTFASAYEVGKEVEAAGEPPIPAMEVPKTIQQGCSTMLVAALDPTLKSKSGAFLKDSQIEPETMLNGYLKDEINAQKLWTRSEKLVGETFAL